MDKLLHNIHVLGEVSGLLANSLISDDYPIESKEFQFDQEMSHHFINKLEAMIRKLNKDFYFSYKHFRTHDQITLAQEHSQNGLSFWMAYTIKACLCLSNVTSNIVFSGFHEENINSARESYNKLRLAISDVVFGIICLNDYGLNYKQDDIFINNHVANMDKVWAGEKGFVDQIKTPIPPEQFPYWLFLYLGNNGELHVDESKITLPMKLDHIHIREKTSD